MKCSACNVRYVDNNHATLCAQCAQKAGEGVIFDGVLVVPGDRLLAVGGSHRPWWRRLLDWALRRKHVEMNGIYTVTAIGEK